MQTPQLRLNSSEDKRTHGKNGVLFDIKVRGEFLTAEQLAVRLNVAPKTIRQWRYKRVIPSECMVKVGPHSVRYVWENVCCWLQNKGDSD